MKPSVRIVLFVNAAILALVGAVALIYPASRALLDLRDPALSQPGIPRKAWRLSANLTPRYAAWARDRIARGATEQPSKDGDISATEWPLFGSVFYLWAMENLQAAWDAGDHRAGVEPRVFAKDAILLSSELIIDPKQAAWVKKRWGDDYMRRENVFYRMMVIASLTSREKLLKDGAHTALLREQVESLAREIDVSRRGLLNDYPSECYPGDVMAAIACIQRGDAMLGVLTNRAELVDRALRGFIGTQSTRLGLPPYQARTTTGRPASDTRGCANSYFCLTAPELWPAQAKQWFQLYEKSFWQEHFTAVGFREYPKGTPNGEWSRDIDAGLVVAGYGVSANAFGVGAARKNGRFDRAYPLAAEMIATVWELPGGVQAVPRLLSNLSDAPLLGEAAILWLLTVQPEKGFPVKTGGSLPLYVHLITIGSLLLGLFLVFEAIWRFRTARREPEREYPAAAAQAVIWAGLLLGGLALLWTQYVLIGLACLFLTQVFPRSKKHPRDKGNRPEDLPPKSREIQGV